MFHDHERMPTAEQALPGRDEPVLQGRPAHLLFGESSRYVPPFPEGLKVACFGNGCFWGPEMRFWEMPGVYSTAVGYCGGLTPNPTCVAARRRSHATASRRTRTRRRRNHRRTRTRILTLSPHLQAGTKRCARGSPATTR